MGGSLVCTDTVVGAEVHDGREQFCLKDKNHDAMAERLQRSKAKGERLVDGRGRDRDDTHSLSYTERFEAVTRFCYDVIIRCTGFDWCVCAFGSASHNPTSSNRQESAHRNHHKMYFKYISHACFLNRILSLNCRDDL